MPNDPRLPGGTYFNAYWQRSYEVLTIWTSTTGPGSPLWFHVRWSDGETSTHCTMWDKRDRIL
jgi:hypothetical protein